MHSICAILLLFEYRHDIFNTIISALIEEEDKGDKEKKLGLGFNKLYKKCKDILKISGLDYNSIKNRFFKSHQKDGGR